MTPTDFLASLESVLQSRRVRFERAAAIAFVESCWELIVDDPDVWYWSGPPAESWLASSMPPVRR
jgi:hypothetical protein